MLALTPTAMVPWELEAAAKAMSAKVKMASPWAMPMPLWCFSVMVIRAVAWPGCISTSWMPSSLPKRSRSK